MAQIIAIFFWGKSQVSSSHLLNVGQVPAWVLSFGPGHNMLLVGFKFIQLKSNHMEFSLSLKQYL